MRFPCIESRHLYGGQVKAIVLALTCGSAIRLAASADEREQISGQELGQKFERGEGQLGPQDRRDHPSIRQQVPQTHP